MKIKKSELKQLIKEELEEVFDPSMIASNPQLDPASLYQVAQAVKQLADPQVLAAAIGGGVMGVAVPEYVRQVAKMAKQLSDSMEDLDLGAGLKRSGPGMAPDGSMAESTQE